jgi:hypothetical protein
LSDIANFHAFNIASPSLFAWPSLFLVVIPEEPALSEAERGICFLPEITVIQPLYHRPSPHTIAAVTFAHVAAAPASVKHYSYALSIV